jgi:hypothetical protein
MTHRCELPLKATNSLGPLYKLLTLSCKLIPQHTSNDADVVDELLLEDGEASLLVDGLQVGVDAASLHDYLQQKAFLFLKSNEGFLDFFLLHAVFNTASSAASQIPLCQRMLGSTKDCCDFAIGNQTLLPLG